MLLSTYFLCEKLSKDLDTNQEEKNSGLTLSVLKRNLKRESINVDERILDLIFLSPLDKKDEKSFRVIRNAVCHSCSIKYRDYAIQHKKEYQDAMDEYLNKLFDKLSF